MIEKKVVAKTADKIVKKTQIKEVKAKDKKALPKGAATGSELDDSQSGMNMEDATELISRRAYELYEQRGRQEGMAAQDWGQAERDVLKDELMKI